MSARSTTGVFLVALVAVMFTLVVWLGQQVEGRTDDVWTQPTPVEGS